MLDQTFTPENFRRIYDIENRKGLDLASRFFPELDEPTEAVRNKVAEIRALRALRLTLSESAYEALRSPLKLQLVLLKRAKSAAVDDLLERVSENVISNAFKFQLVPKVVGPKGMKVYCADDSPESFFVLKQLQHNLNKLYGVKQSNRHDLVCRIRDTLANRFPYEIVRTDISSFYESVDTQQLSEKLDQDQLLSATSKRYIRQILESYNKITGKSIGLPRGIGVSAYLSELYLRQVDREIQAIDGLVLYCRYVDDIAAVFARPPDGHSQGSYLALIKAALEKYKLGQNQKKTKEILLRLPQAGKFEYLGYRFSRAKGQLLVAPSAAKVRKYKKRLQIAFSAYRSRASFDSRGAYRQLVARIRFLTGNARLLNSKESAVTGIYYNNSIVTNLKSFELLDGQLKRHATELKRPKLKSRLKGFSFQKGFQERRFHNFTTRELQMIVGVWKHG